MTWFKENKFLAGLLVITLLLAAAIIFFGLGQGDKLEEKLEEVAQKENSLEEMKNLNPYPTPENAAAKRSSLKAVVAKGKEAQEKVMAFRPESLETISINEFTTALTEKVAAIRELFPENKALPAQFNLGFKAYSGSPPDEKATGILNYQLEATDWLFKELAAAGVNQLVNFHRAELPIEKGEDWPNAAPGKGKANRGGRAGRPRKQTARPPRGGRAGRGARGKSARKPAAPEEILPEIAHRMPIELTVRGKETALRKFLESVANSDKYFYQTRIARVVNPASIPERKGSSTAAAGGDDAAAFGDIAAEPAEGDAAAPAIKVLERVSGSDDIVLYLRADLLLFMEGQSFPEFK